MTKSHLSRREYRAQLNQKKVEQPKLHQSSGSHHGKRSEYTHVKLNLWEVFSDRPYVSVAVLVLALFFIMAKLWWLLILLLLIVAIGIVIIARSHHPGRVLSFEVHLKASKKLSVLRAIQFGGAIVMFLATYMKKVVTVNFASAGSTDGLQVIQGILSRSGGYGQQGSYILSLLNTLTGGQLWGSYRFATQAGQMMNSGSGRNIIMWVFLLMLAPACCVLAQFFREPYSRNGVLVSAIITTVSFILTPSLMKKWIVGYAVENQMSQAAAQGAVTVGGMAYVAMAAAILVLVTAIYRVIKKDQFE